MILKEEGLIEGLRGEEQSVKTSSVQRKGRLAYVRKER